MIGRKGILALISQIFVKLIKAFVFIIAVNTFSPVNFGYYQVGISTMAIFILISDPGISSVYLKKFAEIQNKNLAFTNFIILKIILTVISSLVIFFFGFFLLTYGILSSSIQQLWILLILFFHTIFNNNLSSIYELSFRAKLEIAKLKIPQILSTLLGSVLSLMAILIFRDFFFYLLTLLIESIIKFIFLSYLGRKFKIDKFDIKILKNYIKTTASFVAPTFFFVLINSLGSYFFIYYFNEDLLGVYSVITTAIGLIFMALDSFRLLLIPNYTMILKNQKAKLNPVIELYKKYFLILITILVVSGIIFSRLILNILLGRIYYESGLWFYYFSLISLLEYPLFHFYTPIIIAKEQFRLYTILKMIEFGFSVICWIFLIPILNIIAINLGKWIFIFINAYFLRKSFFKQFGVGKVSKQEIILLLLFTLSVGTSFIITIICPDLISSILLSLLTLGLYIGGLLLLKVIKRKDIMYIMDLLNPFKLKDYIKSEIKGD